MTLYSPFMGAGHCATAVVLLRHLEEDPDAVKLGLEILTGSRLIFVRACIQAGIDGFCGQAVQESRPRRHEGRPK